MKILGALALGALAIACGPSPSANDKPVELQGLDRDPSSGCAAADRNPDGLCYPTGDIAVAPRRTTDQGMEWGSRLPNLGFVGFRRGVAREAPEATTIRLADYYDPGARRANVLVIALQVAWCYLSPRLSDLLETSPPDVAVLQVLLEGPLIGVPATLGDLATFGRATSTTEVGIGPDVLFRETNGRGYPEILIVDPRSMELLEVVAGIDYQIVDRLQRWKDSLAQTPPRP